MPFLQDSAFFTEFGENIEKKKSKKSQKITKNDPFLREQNEIYRFIIVSICKITVKSMVWYRLI